MLAYIFFDFDKINLLGVNSACEKENGAFCSINQNKEAICFSIYFGDERFVIELWKSEE